MDGFKHGFRFRKKFQKYERKLTNEWILTWIQILDIFQYSSSPGLRLALGSFVEDYDNKVQVIQNSLSETVYLILK